MKILRLVMTIQGTSNDVALRPYQTHIDDKNVQNLFLEATNGGSNLSVGTMSKVAGNIMRPSTEVGSNVQIDQGFAERRLRFIMEVEHGPGQRQILTGYTNYVGLTQQGHVDPNMTLHFNQSFSLRDRAMSQQGRGNFVQTSLTEASHYLVAPQLTSSALYGVAPEHTAVTMRPGDMIDTFDTIDSARSYMTDHNVADELVVPNSDNIFSTGIRKSRLSNGNSSVYLSNVVNAMGKAVSEESHDSYDWENKNATASSYVQDSLINGDSFVNGISRLGINLEEGGSVAWGVLATACPELPHVSNIGSLADRMVAMPVNDSRGQAEHMRGNSYETLIASTLSNSLPSLMINHRLTRLDVTIQTCIIPTMQLTVNDPMYGMNNGAHVSINNANGFTKLTADELQAIVPVLENQIANTVAMEISHGGQTQVIADCSIDLIGDSIIQVGYKGGPLIMFNNPQYCSALFAPVLADNQQAAIRTAGDLSTLCNLSSVTPDSMNYKTIY